MLSCNDHRLFACCHALQRRICGLLGSAHFCFHAVHVTLPFRACAPCQSASGSIALHATSATWCTHIIRVQERPDSETQQEANSSEQQSSDSSERQSAAGSAQDEARKAASQAADATAKAQQRLSNAAKSSSQFLSALSEEIMTRTGFRSGGTSQQTGDASQQASGAAPAQQQSSTGAGSAAGGASASQDSAQSSSSSAGTTSFAHGWYKRAQQAFQRSGSQQGASGQAGGGTAEDAQAQKQDFITRLRRDVAEAVLPPQRVGSVMKRRTDVEAVEIKVGEGPSDLVVSVRCFTKVLCSLATRTATAAPQSFCGMAHSCLSFCLELQSVCMATALPARFVPS